MIPWFGAAARRRRLKRQAAAWAVRILDDRERHAGGLRRCVGHDQERADLYNAAYRATQEARVPLERLFGNARERASWVPLPASHPSWRRLGLAVGTILILGGAGIAMSLGLLQGAFHKAPSDPSSATPTIIATRVGEIRPVRLADGSRVILDTDTLLHVSYTNALRSVRLDRGRARFEVAPGSLPFVVSAGDGTITGRGAMFDVAVYRTIKVQLLSGVVDVAYPRPASHATPIVRRLIAGQQLRYDPSMSEEPIAPSRAPPSDAQWVTGMQTFDDVAVSEIIEAANRYSETKIELADPSLGQRQAFLDLDLRDTREVARNLATFLGLQADESRPGVITLKRPG